jgi:hypothetical protein
MIHSRLEDFQDLAQMGVADLAERLRLGGGQFVRGADFFRVRPPSMKAGNN